MNTKDIKKIKKQMANLIQGMDIYTTLKVHCAANGITIRKALREAIQDYLAKHS